ncbi:MAG: DUF1059 domain-containing protein [Acidimicrobiales bacterium]
MSGCRRLVCACGWTTEGTAEEVFAATLEHGRRLHNMEVTAEQVDAMSTPQPDPE